MADERIAVLQRGSRRLTLICSATLLIGAGLLSLSAQNPDFSARRWMMIAALTLAGLFWFLSRVLDRNHAPESSELYPDLGLANRITIYRGLAYAWMAGFLLQPRPGGLADWLPALLYLGASLSDILDGYVARKTRRITRLGETLDIEFDGFGILVACGLAVQYGQLPPVFLLVGAARPLFVWGMRWRTRTNLPNAPLTESDQRRIMAGLLMIFLSTVLWPIFEPPETYVVGSVFGGGVALSFLRDWLVTIGWIRPDGAAYTLWRSRMKKLAFVWAPVALRVAIALLASLLVARVLLAQATYPAALGWVIVAGGTVGGLAALLGIGARTSSAPLGLAAYCELALGGQTWLALSLLFLASFLLVLGSGKYTWWVPEEGWLRFGAGKERGTPSP